MTLLKQRVHGVGDLYISPNGLLLPGINRATNQVNKIGLKFWAAQVEREHMLNVAATEFELSAKAGGKSGEVFRARLAEAAGNLACTRKATEALDAGTQARQFIDWWLRGRLPGASREAEPVVGDTALLIGYAFEYWAQERKLMPVIAQQPIFNEADGYVAESVTVMTRPTGPIILEIATGKEIYMETMMIAAANLQAAQQAGIPVKGATIIRIPKEGDLKLEPKIMTPKELEDHLHLFYLHLGIWQTMTGYTKPVRITNPPTAPQQVANAG